MPEKQISEEQYYHLKYTLLKIQEDLLRSQSALDSLLGSLGGSLKTENQSEPLQSEPLKENLNNNKKFSIKPPVVSPNHKSSVDSIDPEVIANTESEKQNYSKSIIDSISRQVQVINNDTDGLGNYFVTVRCNETNLEAAINIDKLEYEEIGEISDEDEVMMTLTEDQVLDAEWDAISLSLEKIDCSCDNKVPNNNPTNNFYISLEMQSKHRKSCRFWDANTIILDEKTGEYTEEKIINIDKSAINGFELFSKAIQDSNISEEKEI